MERYFVRNSRAEVPIAERVLSYTRGFARISTVFATLLSNYFEETYKYVHAGRNTRQVYRDRMFVFRMWPNVR